MFSVVHQRGADSGIARIVRGRASSSACARNSRGEETSNSFMRIRSLDGTASPAAQFAIPPANGVANGALRCHGGPPGAVPSSRSRPLHPAANKTKQKNPQSAHHAAQSARFFELVALEALGLLLALISFRRPKPTRGGSYHEARVHRRDRDAARDLLRLLRGPCLSRGSLPDRPVLGRCPTRRPLGPGSSHLVRYQRLQRELQRFLRRREFH